MAEDQELERWVDWTLQSVAWHEERAEVLEDVPRVTEAERREALRIAGALEAAEDDEPDIVYSYTEPCMCGQIHPV